MTRTRCTGGSSPVSWSQVEPASAEAYRRPSSPRRVPIGSTVDLVERRDGLEALADDAEQARLGRSDEDVFVDAREAGHAETLEFCDEAPRRAAALPDLRPVDHGPQVGSGAGDRRDRSAAMLRLLGTASLVERMQAFARRDVDPRHAPMLSPERATAPGRASRIRGQLAVGTSSSANPVVTCPHV